MLCLCINKSFCCLVRCGSSFCASSVKCVYNTSAHTQSVYITLICRAIPQKCIKTPIKCHGIWMIKCSISSMFYSNTYVIIMSWKYHGILLELWMSYSFSFSKNADIHFKMIPLQLKLSIAKLWFQLTWLKSTAQLSRNEFSIQSCKLKLAVKPVFNYTPVRECICFETLLYCSKSYPAMEGLRNGSIKSVKSNWFS